MTPCPSTHDLSAAITDGTPPPHVATCAACAAAWSATRDMIALAREVGPALPPPARREEVRTMLLAAGRSADVLAAPRHSRRTWGYATGALAVAAAAAAIAVAITRAPRTPATHVHATITPLAGAKFDATHTAPDEIVTLHDGAIDVQVAPLHAGERFRIVLADAEIEVHGTRFVATADAGKLVRVDVTHGIVEVRPRIGDAVLLRVGESWHVPAVKVTQAPAVDTTVIDPPTPAPIKQRRISRSADIARSDPARTGPADVARTAPADVARTAPTDVAREVPSDVARERAERLPQERAYDDGWAAMRSSRFADAAAAFARVQLLDPDGALAEDATYWYAVALARANESRRATTAFRDYLDRYGTSRRAGEASTMLGWLLVGAKQYGEAGRRFRAAASDPNPAVRESAKAGLEAVSSQP